MIVSSIAAKIAWSAFVALLLIMIADAANGTLGGGSPAWIYLPGALAAIIMFIAAFVTIIAAIGGF